MERHLAIERLNLTDLVMYQCGTQDCEPSHSWGPAVRDYYLIHYISGGKGIYQTGGITYYLEKGNGFLICPDMVTYYEADKLDPWTYSWVGFHGMQAETYLKKAGLTEVNPIFKYETDDYIENCFAQMIEAGNMNKCRELRLTGLLYLFLSQLIEVFGRNEPDDGKNRKRQYVKKAVEFMEMNYSRSMSIAELSRYIGLDRSYLCSIFKECLNLSPQEYLIGLRIEKAVEFMQNGVLSIGDISRCVGYDDPLLFSKVFKKLRGLSPRDYRKLI